MNERVDNILSLCDVDIKLLKPGVYEAVASELLEAEREAKKERDKYWLSAAKSLEEEGYAEGFRAAQAMDHCCCDETKECQRDTYVKGFNAAREKARAIAEESLGHEGKSFTDCHYEIAQRIGEMKP